MVNETELYMDKMESAGLAELAALMLTDGAICHMPVVPDYEPTYRAGEEPVFDC